MMVNIEHRKKVKNEHRENEHQEMNIVKMNIKK